MNLLAQVGINTNTPDASSVLDINSSTKGILLPRLTTGNVADINTPATGLTLFNTTEKCIQQNIGTPAFPQWECIISEAEPTVKVFYPPALALDVSETGTDKTLDLHSVYQTEFTTPAVSSTGSSGSIPTYAKTALEYYVTAYDTAVLTIKSIDGSGVMTYDVIGTPTSDCSMINVVFVVK